MITLEEAVSTAEKLLDKDRWKEQDKEIDIPDLETVEKWIEEGLLNESLESSNEEDEKFCRSLPVQIAATAELMEMHNTEEVKEVAERFLDELCEGFTSDKKLDTDKFNFFQESEAWIYELSKTAEQLKEKAQEAQKEDPFDYDKTEGVLRNALNNLNLKKRAHFYVHVWLKYLERYRSLD